MSMLAALRAISQAAMLEQWSPTRLQVRQDLVEGEAVGELALPGLQALDVPVPELGGRGCR